MHPLDPTRRRFLGLCACGAVHLCAPRPAHAGRPLAEPEPETRASNKQTILDLRSQSVQRGWKWIVIHHTASGGASVAGLDAYHRRRFDDELGAEYHFVVNNGVKGPDGAIQLARWRHQVPAMHLFHPERAPESLAIVLVGNFETKGPPSGAQMQALGQLTRTLMAKFEIPSDRVTTHRGVDGRLTQCPGQHFSLEALKKQLL